MDTIKDQPESWYQRFKEYVSRNKNIRDVIIKLTDIYSRQRLESIFDGEVDLNSIPLGKRFRLAQITGLDCFDINGEDPRKLDMEKVKGGEQSRALIRTRLEYEGVTSRELLDRLGVTKHNLQDYLRGKKISRERQVKIETGLTQYFANTSEAKASGDALPIAKQDNERTDIITHLAEVQNSLRRIYEIIGDLSPSEIKARLLILQEQRLETRVKTVSAAIEILGDQVEYFASAPQEERERVAKAINPNLWGYIATILPYINQPNSWQTATRLMNKPRRN